MSSNSTASVPAPTPAVAIESSYQYDSDWMPASNEKSFNLVFDHNFGVVPTQLMVMFSPDKTTCYPLTWSWAKESGNPVTISVTSDVVTLAISSDYKLHSVWDGQTKEWTHYAVGYFRAFASR